jgi:peptidyl-prolyl cis-trans isomerase SurA
MTGSAEATEHAGITRLDKIVAIVNRDVITQSQVNKEIERARHQVEQSHQPMPSDAEMRKKILDHLIAKSLQMQLVKSKNIKVTQEELDKAIKNVITSNKIDMTQLKQAIEQTGMTFDEYKKNLAEQISMQKLQQEEVARTVTVTPEDVSKISREYKNKLNQFNAFHVIDVVLSIPENSTAAQVTSLKKQAAEYAAQLQKGKSTEALAKEHPDLQNNDLGWRSLNEFPSLFQPKVAELRLKAISAPIAAPNGIHILQLVEARGENVARLSESDLKNIAFQFKTKEALQGWTDKLRKDAYVRIMK